MTITASATALQCLRDDTKVVGVRNYNARGRTTRPQNDPTGTAACSGCSYDG